MIRILTPLCVMANNHCASMNLAEKLAVQVLADMGGHYRGRLSDRIPGDFEAVKQIAQTVRGSTICGLAMVQ